LCSLLALLSIYFLEVLEINSIEIPFDFELLPFILFVDFTFRDLFMETLTLNHCLLFLSRTLLFFCVFFCFLYHLQACCNSSWIYGIRDPLNQFWYGKSEVDCQIHPNLLLRSNFSCLYIKLFYCLNGNYLQFCCTSCNQSISIFSQPLARFATNFSFDYFVNYLMFNRLLRSLSISETYPCFTIQPFIFC
jgi:hypothetical protein